MCQSDWLESLLPEEYHREKFRDAYDFGLTTAARGNAEDGKEIYLVGFKSSHPFDVSFVDENKKNKNE